VWVSTHYHADYVSPGWAKKLRRTGQIGRHIFYAAGTA
jgi:spore germination cell wall hydrolase CwlJ-like protein